jgi:hypothetical protein
MDLDVELIDGGEGTETLHEPARAQNDVAH